MVGSSMVTPLGTDPGRAPRYSLILLLMLALAGIGGNFLRLPIFFSIEFLFGSVASLFALQLLGLGPGLIVAVAASSVTYFLWNHPYAMVIMTCEVLAVGLLRRKWRFELVLADALYWLLVGIPLVYLFYRLVMGLPPSNASITLMKQALNGIANALIARLLFMLARPRSEAQLPSMREFVFNLLALFVLAPSLVLLAIQSRSDFADTDQAIRQSLRLSAHRVSVNLERWLDHRAADVARIARIATTLPPSEVQRNLEETMALSGDFVQIEVCDQSERVVASSPALSADGIPENLADHADRPYLSALKESLRPMFSEALVDQAGTPSPMVLALAPVLEGGTYAGYVDGVLSLDGLDSLIAVNAAGQTLHGLQYVLVDKNGRVIVTNRTDLGPMEPLVRENGEILDFGNGVSEWIPPSRRNISISDRWKNSVYIAETEIGPMSEWRLVLEQRVEPYQASLFSDYSGRMAIALGILVAALPLAGLLSRRVSRSLHQLEMSTGDIPSRIDSGRRIEWPRSNIRETEHLIENFKEVTEALAVQFGEIRRVNGDLVQALDEVQTLRGILPICSYCKSIRNDAGAWEQMEAYVSRHSGAQFSHGLCPKCLAAHYPEFEDEFESRG